MSGPWLHPSRLSCRWRITNSVLHRNVSLQTYIGNDVKRLRPDLLRKGPPIRRTTHEFSWEVDIKGVLRYLKDEGWSLRREPLPPPLPKWSVTLEEPRAAVQRATQIEMEALKKENESLQKTVSELSLIARAKRIECFNAVLSDRRSIRHVRSASVGPGVYFLWSQNVLVYIGMSNTLSKRLTAHASEKVPFFDAFSVLLTEDDTEAFFLESLFIGLNRPKYNKSGTKSELTPWLADTLNGEFRAA